MILKYIFLFYITFFSGIYFAHTILVTGGSGFIGTHLVEKLLEQNYTVIVDNFYAKTKNIVKKYDILKKLKMKELQKKYSDRLISYTVNITDKKSLENIFENHSIDVVCHLAATGGVRSSIEDPVFCLTTNLVGTVHLFECMKKYSVSHCILASSSSVYGQSEEKLFCETQMTDRQANPYAVSKKAIELLAYTYYYLYNIQTTCLRFFSVYGPYGRTDMAPFLFMDAIAHTRPITIMGDGSAMRDFIYVDDAVNGILQAINKPLGYEIINLGGGKGIILKDFITMIEKIVGQKAVIHYSPSSPTEALFTFASIEKAQSLLNYIPKTNIEIGIQKMYEWYQKEREIQEQLNKK
jgi:UDP-glucuronate 4-epimerase